jgi:cell wall-associated NlpC family hydrolase
LVAAVAVATLLGSSLFAATAGADPVADKQAQAAALAKQIDDLGAKEAALSEQYDKVALEVQGAQANIARSSERAAQADADAGRARSLLRDDSLDAYVHGGTLSARFGGPVDAQATILRAEYAQTLASAQSDHLDQFRTTAAQAHQAAAALDSARQQAAAKAAQLDSARRATVTSEQKLQATLAQVKGDIATQVAQIQVAKQADQARQAQQQLLVRQQAAATPASSGTPTAAPPVPTRSKPSSPGSTSVPTPSRPAASVGSGGAAAVAARPAAPVGSGGAAAVAAAKTRLGLPYVWAAAGPDSFDCSGLTMWAWAHAGVSLPHFSGAQYASTTHVSMADLQPGDLVFEADTGAHVAMYIGGGQIIASPHTGTVVQIQPLSGNYVLASRP